MSTSAAGVPAIYRDVLQLIKLGLLATGSQQITSITRDAFGRVTAITGPSYSATITYDGTTGYVSTFTENGTTFTLTYNGDGTLASVQ